VLNNLKIKSLLLWLGCRTHNYNKILFKTKEFHFESYTADHVGGSWLTIHLVKPFGVSYKIYDSNFSGEFEHGSWSYSFFKIVQKMEKEVNKREAEELALLIKKQKAKESRAEKKVLKEAKDKERNLNRINNYFNKKRWK